MQRNVDLINQYKIQVIRKKLKFTLVKNISILMASQLSPRAQTYLIWLISLIAIGNLIINYLWRQHLYNLGLDIIASFQQSQNLALTILFTIPTTLIDPGLIIVVCFIGLIKIKQKETIINIIVWILLNAFGSCLLKAFYADPRPFWSRQDIQSLGLNCPQQYGNPSGHSWFSVIVGFGLILIHNGPGTNYKNLYISFSLIIFVPMSRMYLGAHSLNQVIQGLFFGFLMVVLYQFCGLKEGIESFLNNFNTDAEKRWKKLIGVLHLAYVVGFVINLKEYNPYLEPIPENWAQNIIDQCNKSTPPHHLNFTMLMLNSLIVNFATGLAWGFEEVSTSQKGQIYLSGNWVINEQRYALCVGYFWFFLFEAGLLLIWFVPCGIAVYLLGLKYWVFFVFGNIGSFLSGYFYTSKSYKMLFERQVIRQQIN